MTLLFQFQFYKSTLAAKGLSTEICVDVNWKWHENSCKIIISLKIDPFIVASLMNGTVQQFPAVT